MCSYNWNFYVINIDVPQSTIHLQTSTITFHHPPVNSQSPPPLTLPHPASTIYSSLFFSNHQSPLPTFHNQHSTFHHLLPMTHDSLSSSHPPPLAICFPLSTFHTPPHLFPQLPPTTHPPKPTTHHLPASVHLCQSACYFPPFTLKIVFMIIQFLSCPKDDFTFYTLPTTWTRMTSFSDVLF